MLSTSHHPDVFHRLPLLVIRIPPIPTLHTHARHSRRCLIHLVISTIVGGEPFGTRKIPLKNRFGLRSLKAEKLRWILDEDSGELWESLFVAI